jgi:hypothetical protein
MWFIQTAMCIYAFDAQLFVFYILSLCALLMPLRERLGNDARARLHLIAC